MPTLPRIRQLRRDKTVFALALNAIRLQLEEADLLYQQPHLAQAPDASLLLVQQGIDQWVSLASNYLMRKYRCSLGQAMQLLGELQLELRQGIPASELRQIPLQEVLALPASLAAGQQAAAEAPPAATTAE